jgi:hypothetical protein
MSRYIPETLRSVIHVVIQRNGYFAHPENILLSMMADERDFVRELAFRWVVSIRKNTTFQQNVRRFQIPSINMEANDYIDLINWNHEWKDAKIMEPPMIKHIETEDLEIIILSKEWPTMNFIKFHCHTQNMERNIRIVTEASQKVFGEDRRDGYIRATLQSRNLMPSFRTKKDYRV